MSKYIQISLMLVLLCSACQDPVDADELLNVDDGTYIIGYLSPTDTVLTVHVSTAVPAVGTPIYDHVDDMGYGSNTDPFIIKDATVHISDEDDNEIQLIYNPESRNYQVDASEFDIKGEATYFLRVSVNNQEFTSSCTIPKKIEPITEKITAGEKNEFYQDYNLDIAFQDISGSKNYYIIGAIAEETHEGETYPYTIDFELSSFLTDVIGDGETLSANSIITNYDVENSTTVKITLQVANVEETLYLNRRATYLNDYNDGNPFVEYSIMPNNIEGKNGVGVFAGYQLTEKVIEYELNGNP
ncbi:DUF4249 family protein [uncultured Zobellia sp.]|uniref:DUF4249 family protein n=1 Tax=uncultured Zobellia sp. TaxID=255433 RepID=UPI002593C51E|nr:DUF4249 family protein [uncultured Zobellia sp.]